MKLIVVVENLAVILCVVASLEVSVFASEANFHFIFSAFALSSLTLTVVLFIKKQFAQMRLQLFFVVMNLFALVKLAIVQ